MDNYRLKVKIGDFEFEAEGPHDVVQAQFSSFQDMVATVGQRRTNQPPDPPANTNTPPPANDGNGNSEPSKADPAVIDIALNKIMRVDNRVVSLTATPSAPEDAVLLLLYGQRMMRNNETATGSEIVDGLTATGGIDFGRSARLLERVARNGDVIMIGERRGKRYRLTNAGMNKARQIAASLIALVA